jgi:hypothetical protein
MQKTAELPRLVGLAIGGGVLRQEITKLISFLQELPQCVHIFNRPPPASPAMA